MMRDTDPSTSASVGCTVKTAGNTYNGEVPVGAMMVSIIVDYYPCVDMVFPASKSGQQQHLWNASSETFAWWEGC